MMIGTVSKDSILSFTTPRNIYAAFLDLPDLPKGNISSPFSEDKEPSCRFFSNDTFMCFSTGKQGDVFSFVAELNHLDCSSQFSEVLNIIADKMNFPMQSNTYSNASMIANRPVQAFLKGDTSGQKPENTKKTIRAIRNTEIASAKVQEEPFSIKIKAIDFQPMHIEFWNNLGVSAELLQRFDVHAVSTFTYNRKGSWWKTANDYMIFSYKVNENFEVYIPAQPVKDVQKRFFNGLQSQDVFGMAQLPDGKTQNIIICAGKKDALVAVSRGFPAVSFQSESIMPASEHIEALQAHCNQLIVCYDNDKGGESGSARLLLQYPALLQVRLPDPINDITDYFQIYNAENFQTLIDEAVKKEIPSAEKVVVSFSQYELPHEVDVAIEDVESDIINYSMFVSNNKIWMLRGRTGKQYFEPVSNFEIEIIQHMQDEKFPMKLLRIKNVFNLEKIFDIPSDRLNTIPNFDNCVTAHGNFLFTGTQNDFKHLRGFLFDKMGNGRKVEILGWQKEDNFWIWNNHVNLTDGTHIDIDDNGIFHYKSVSYYIPSANKIYRNNAFKYQPQKKVKLASTDIPFDVYMSKMMEVHREFAITGLLFTISSIFQDIVVDEISNFPLLFLYGATSTGKDQLAECCQSFFGHSQTAINLEGGASTLKAHVRELAQFNNLISHLSEYKRGDPKLDGILKGFWDRRGYKRGTIDSHVGTESIPVLSSVILTGNEYPDAEALISRVLWLEMNKNEFTTEESKKYEELRDLTAKGISAYTDSLLQYRQLYLDNFKLKFAKYKENLKVQIPRSNSRMISNLSVLGATYEIFKDVISFPFTHNEMVNHFEACTDNQMRKLNSASVINKFWDCFLASTRGHRDDRIVVFRDLRLDGNRLQFNFTSCYNKIQRQWSLQYRDTAPAKSIIQDLLKTEDSFITQVKSVRMDSGRGSINTSAYVVDLLKLPIADELKNAVEWQIVERNDVAASEN